MCSFIPPNQKEIVIKPSVSKIQWGYKELRSWTWIPSTESVSGGKRMVSACAQCVWATSSRRSGGGGHKIFATQVSDVTSTSSFFNLRGGLSRHPASHRDYSALFFECGSLSWIPCFFQCQKSSAKTFSHQILPSFDLQFPLWSLNPLWKDPAGTGSPHLLLISRKEYFEGHFPFFILAGAEIPISLSVSDKEYFTGHLPFIIGIEISLQNTQAGKLDN